MMPLFQINSETQGLLVVSISMQRFIRGWVDLYADLWMCGLDLLYISPSGS
jgi:hypothetical protein